MPKKEKNGGKENGTASESDGNLESDGSKEDHQAAYLLFLL